MSDTAIVASVAVLVAFFTWLVTLYNARKAVQWKRAELANNYLKDLSSNPVIVFACRSLEWNGGRLVVPEALRPLLPDGEDTIEHDPKVLSRAMNPNLSLNEMAADPRLQIYRTALDDLLSWLDLVSSGLDRKLFDAQDLPKVGYWVMHIETVGFLGGFIRHFGYQDTMTRLSRRFSEYRAYYRDGRASTIKRGGLGQSARKHGGGGGG